MRLAADDGPAGRGQSRSMTWTDQPRPASSRATDSPKTPAPTTSAFFTVFPSPSGDEEGSQGVTVGQLFQGLVDLGERPAAGDQRDEVELAGHVAVDEPGEVPPRIGRAVVGAQAPPAPA